MRIDIVQLSKRFGDTEVLRGVTLSVASGSRVALVGPNGSGKSTLIRALLGLVTCEGDVRLDGRSPIADRRALARRVAYVPQVAPQLAAPVGEVVAAVASLRGLDRLHIADVARALDLHLAELSDRPFRALSGGMKQKLLIALALSAGADLLVMDEPTASLDDVARDRFVRLLAERAGATVILCSHRLDEVRHFVARVVTMADGRVASDASAAGAPVVRRLQAVVDA